MQVAVLAAVMKRLNLTVVLCIAVPVLLVVLPAAALLVSGVKIENRSTPSCTSQIKKARRLRWYRFLIQKIMH